MSEEKRRYAETHEWALPGDGQVTVGLSRHAAEQISDIVFIELPAPGQAVRRGEPFGTVESVKAVFDINAPVSGKVTAVNEAVTAEPELVSREPQAGGWLIRIEPENAAEVETLMDEAAYGEFIRKNAS